MFVEPGGDIQATVLEQRLDGSEGIVDAVLAGDSTRHLGMRYSVVDEACTPVFYVERYTAAQTTSFGVYKPNGDAIAVYLPGDPFVIRDGTGTPVATMAKSKDRFNISEVGGGLVGQCWREPLDLPSLVDDQWGLTVLDEPAVLDRRALVACPLVCRLLWSPPPRRKDPNQPDPGLLLAQDR